MKKLKNILLVMLAFLVILSFNIVANAHSVELDPESVISFPFIIYNGEGNITVSSSITNYDLYYQAVELPDDTYEQIKNIRTEGESLLDSMREELDVLSGELDELEVIYEQAVDHYNSLVEQGAESSEIEEARAAYETAKENYDNKVDEYEAKVDEHNNKVDEIEKNMNELTPMYDDNAWTQTEDGSFKIDSSGFSGTKAYVLWARLIQEDGTIVYDEVICTVEGTIEEDVKVTSVELNRSELSLAEGSTYTLRATVSPEDATNKTLVWTSDNEEVATVEGGVVTAVSKGTATITVRTNDGDFEDTCTVTVTDRIVIDDPDNNEDNNDNNDNNNNNDSDDPTTADGELPQTGTSYIIVAAVVIIAVVAIVLYKKMRNNDYK